VTKGASNRRRRSSGSGRRTAAKLAWSLCAVCVVLIGRAILFDFLTDEVVLLPDAPDLRPGPAIAVLTGVLALAYPTIGALIASRLPANPVGWIFCGTGLCYAAQRFASAYADYALLENFAFPGGEYAAWLSSCVWFACLTLGVFLILLFPDGPLPSRRWRIVAWAAILGAALVTIGFAFIPETLILTHPLSRTRLRWWRS
jgi:two-component system, NarL family, sensor kinase